MQANCPGYFVWHSLDNTSASLLLPFWLHSACRAKDCPGSRTTYTLHRDDAATVDPLEFPEVDPGGNLLLHRVPLLPLGLHRSSQVLGEGGPVVVRVWEGQEHCRPRHWPRSGTPAEEYIAHIPHLARPQQPLVQRIKRLESHPTLSAQVQWQCVIQPRVGPSNFSRLAHEIVQHVHAQIRAQLRKVAVYAVVILNNPSLVSAQPYHDPDRQAREFPEDVDELVRVVVTLGPKVIRGKSIGYHHHSDPLFVLPEVVGHSRHRVVDGP
mmetsp:Transcript_8479/g.25619  ORF Transcript_8479/g.25619 Transcript_8479/m.25619 type:complete len:267 (-) Transcript_8479:2528-3328(-)